ncbi:hypothetical protein V7S76_10445 [Aquirufa sp. ROCK2-A2]
MLKSFFQFLIHPEIKENDGVFTWKHLKAIFLVYFVRLVITAILCVIIRLINGDLLKSTLVLLRSTFSGENYVHPVYIVIVAPILEELQFRLPMDLKRNSICLGLAIFLGNFILYFLNIPLFYDDFQVLTFLEFLFTYGVLFFVFTWIHKTYLDNWRMDIPNYLVFYFLSILFAIMHLFNYVPLDTNLSFEYLNLVCLYFVGAIALGYLRCHYGFWCGVLLHILFNFLYIFR